MMKLSNLILNNFNIILFNDVSKGAFLAEESDKALIN